MPTQIFVTFMPVGSSAEYTAHTADESGGTGASERS